MITAAAVVMVVLFASFIGGGHSVIEIFGLALASAVFLPRDRNRPRSDLLVPAGHVLLVLLIPLALLSLLFPHDLAAGIDDPSRHTQEITPGRTPMTH